jgi:hypothetical protein
MTNCFLPFVALCFSSGAIEQEVSFSGYSAAQNRFLNGTVKQIASPPSFWISQSPPHALGHRQLEA